MADIFDLFKKIEKTPAAAPLPVTHLIVGLGNPGREYAGTRHNVGFDAVAALADSLGVRIDRARFGALTAEATVGGVRALMMLPQTFMNLSGTAVAEAVKFYKLPPESILVYCDDVSFVPGRLRIRRSGSHGGHNGLKNIIACLGSDAFPRVKIGVGQKPEGYDLADFVLGKLSDGDASAIRERREDLIDTASLVLSGRIEDAMMKYSK